MVREGFFFKFSSVLRCGMTVSEVNICFLCLLTISLLLTGVKVISLLLIAPTQEITEVLQINVVYLLGADAAVWTTKQFCLNFLISRSTVA